MFAARYRLTALDALWFRGLGHAGNAWDPNLLHASALNFALVGALGFDPPHALFGSMLWAAHSLPYPGLGLWLSPATLVEGTAMPVEVFRGGSRGGFIQVQVPGDTADAKAEADKRGAPTTGWRESYAPDGSFKVVGGKAPNTGKPYSTTGYFGQWEGVLLVRDEEAAALLPGGLQGGRMGVRLGPNRVLLDLQIEPLLPVVAGAGELGEADHLSDPCLLPDGLAVHPLAAKPYPVVGAPADAIAGDLKVRTISFGSEV